MYSNVTTSTINKFYKCTYIHLCLFHSKLPNIQHQAAARANNNWSGYTDQGACQELVIQEGRRGAMKDWPTLPCHCLLWSLHLYPEATRSNTDIWQNDWKGKDPWENMPGLQVLFFLTGLVAHIHTKIALCQAEVVKEVKCQKIFELPVIHMSNIKNSPIRGWGGLCPNMPKMSIIKLSQFGQDLFDFSDLTWAHPLTHQSTHS